MENDDTRTPEEDRPEEESSSVGAMLRAAREEKELSVEQLAAELRIEPRFLNALEDDSFEEFPAPVFTKGYIRQYAQRVGLDYADLLAEYYRQVEVRDVRVVLVGPAHRVPVVGVAAADYSAFRVPGGSLPVDSAAIERLARSGLASPDWLVEVEAYAARTD